MSYIRRMRVLSVSNQVHSRSLDSTHDNEINGQKIKDITSYKKNIRIIMIWQKK